MQQSNKANDTSTRATGGRAASRERRAALSQGKTGLPTQAERTRTGFRSAAILPVAAASPVAINVAPAVVAAPAPQHKPVAPSREPAASWARNRITGTLFTSDEGDTEGGSAAGCCAGNFVTGDTPGYDKHVTGTQRGAKREISGTSYVCTTDRVARGGSMSQRTNGGFSTPQSQSFANRVTGTGTGSAGGGSSRITGAFARGDNKITGNQEFHFGTRAQPAAEAGSTHITGEGSSEGPALTGGAWDANANVTGTEGHFAADRNPTERGGSPRTFASARLFKGKGNHKAPTQHVTGMVGWSAKTAARVTLSGGAQG